MTNSQGVGGFKIDTISQKKGKIKLVLIADIGDVVAGEYDVGDVLKALHCHDVSETEVGLSVIVEEK